MKGKVIVGKHAILPVVLIDRQGQPYEIDFIVDTGFTGDVTLPPEAFDTMDLSYTKTKPAEVAGRASLDCRRFEAHVLWDGVLRTVEVVELDDEPILGMGLLKDHRLTVDVYDGGNVDITPLATNN